MLKFVIILSAVVCALTGTVPVSQLQQSNGRIVGGENTTIEAYPFVVAIELWRQFFCGGSIISETFIVSAAHCVPYKVESWYKVRVGCTHLYKDGLLTEVGAIIVHENFNSKTLDNDISLLKLKSPITFGFNMKPINLATEDPKDGASAYVVGWGVEQPGANNPSDVLKVAFLYLISRVRCESKEFGYGTAIGLNMTCAGAEGKDSCQGDSGGPLAWRGILVGIVSWGYGCANPRHPGVYTSIPKYETWIHNIVATK